MEKKTEQITVTGYVGPKHQYHLNDETKKSVISFSIKPNNADWVRVKAFNENANLIKEAIDQGEVKKLGITGKMKDGVPYEKSTGEIVNYQELVADNVVRYKPIEISGVIAKVEEKKTANDKEYLHLFIKNNVNLGDMVKTENHNVNIYSETRKTIPADVEVAVGKPIAIKGEVALSTYQDKDKNKKEAVNITAWNVARTPTLLRQQIAELQKNAVGKSEKAQDMAAASSQKPSAKKQDNQISM